VYILLLLGISCFFVGGLVLAGVKFLHAIGCFLVLVGLRALYVMWGKCV